MAPTATTDVRFFFDGSVKRFEHKHAIPTDLIKKNGKVIPEQGLSKTFRAMVWDILHEHKDECVLAVPRTCSHCHAPAAAPYMRATTALHRRNDPTIHVLVSPKCDNEQCVTHTRPVRHMAARGVVGDLAGTGPHATEGKFTTREYRPCRRCGGLKKIIWCRSCLAVSYCSEECQRLHGEEHRKECVSMY